MYWSQIYTICMFKSWDNSRSDNHYFAILSEFRQIQCGSPIFGRYFLLFSHFFACIKVGIRHPTFLYFLQSSPDSVWESNFCTIFTALHLSPTLQADSVRESLLGDLFCCFSTFSSLSREVKGSAIRYPTFLYSSDFRQIQCESPVFRRFFCCFPTFFRTYHTLQPFIPLENPNYLEGNCCAPARCI